jgi:hypothetical protein
LAGKGVNPVFKKSTGSFPQLEATADKILRLAIPYTQAMEKRTFAPANNPPKSSLPGTSTPLASNHRKEKARKA